MSDLQSEMDSLLESLENHEGYKETLSTIIDNITISPKTERIIRISFAMGYMCGIKDGGKDE